MRLLVGSTLCAFAVAACGGSSPTSSTTGSNPGGAAAAASVSIMSTAYSPSNVSIKAGESVQWTNHDPTAHSVTADAAGGFDSNLSGTTPDGYGGTTAGGTFKQSFPSAGTFTYHCTYHASMHGTVTVSP